MVGHVDPTAEKTIARLGYRAMCLKYPMMDSARLFDWPACFQVFGNRPDKSPH
jgi:hypothetical protein